MRSQSSIEFLSTYSFLFLLMGVVISVIIFVTNSPSTIIPSQCSALGGPVCNFVQIYTNQSADYSLITFSLTNSQSVPINVTNTIVTVKSSTYTGACTPSFLYPGQSSTCAAQIGAAASTTSLVQGFYQLNAAFCNSGAGSLSSYAACNFELVQYGGAFVTTPSVLRSMVFSVAALQGPSNLQLLPFSSISASPTQPSNFTLMQNGGWTSNITSGTLAYAFAGKGAMLGSSYLGYKTLPYPSSLSTLSNPDIACSSPFNSILSIASTTLYISSAASAPLTIETGGGMNVFYRVAQPGTAWQNSPGSGAWTSGQLSGNQVATTFPANTLSLSKGLYNLEVWWTNPCGSGGGQVFTLGSLPN